MRLYVDAPSPRMSRVRRKSLLGGVRGRHSSSGSNGVEKVTLH